ncbi:MAG TPA: DUF2785 domain-containing protein [Vicinamibacterales bacterium]|nr:DUF2785 domain-containing protein [Vicinamibacterales bacterium]
MSMRACAAVLIALSCAGTAAAAPAHDVAFWRAVARDKYAPPPGSDVPALVDELTAMLASPDPELRDDIAYSTLTSWIYQQKIVDAAAMRALVDRLLANLTRGIGERDTDSVLERSFSALMLSVVVARDNADPFLDANDWRRVETAALAYLAAEQDLRGYDAGKGWMHSAAHTADLLKFLGRSRYLDLAGQRRFLDAIAGKLTTASVVFTHGEDERLARAALSLIARRDFDEPQFAAWLQRTRPAVPEHPQVAQLRAAQNWKNMLAKLEVILSNDPQPSDAAAAARSALRDALKPLF